MGVWGPHSLDLLSLNNMTPEQNIIERLYREIDVANADLKTLGIRVYISRTLEVTDFRESGWSTKDIPEPQPPPSLYTGSFCTECGGMMVQTGNCQTCQNCGTTSGGCD